MEVEVEATAAVTEVAAMGIHLDLAGSLPGGRCNCRTVGASSPYNPGEDCLCTTQSRRLAAVLDPLTTILPFLANSF